MPVLIGVTSASYKCGLGKHPTLFVRTSAYSDFLPLQEINDSTNHSDHYDNTVNVNPQNEKGAHVAIIVLVSVVGATVLIMVFLTIFRVFLLNETK